MSFELIDVKSAIIKYTALLAQSSSTPELDVSLLLEFVAGVSRVNQIAFPEKKLSAEEHQRLDQAVRRRAQQEPIAYIVGHKGFWKYDFFVDKRVLIPRPETELIVEQGMQFLNQRIEKLSAPKAVSILDLGTGSGCIGLSILKDLQDQYGPDLRIAATLADKSSEALSVAKENGERLNADTPSCVVSYLVSDWFKNVSGQFDLIVSNPPYISKNDPRVYPGAKFEPSEALYADREGHADIETLLNNIPGYLKKDGLALIEIGLGSADVFRCRVTDILKDMSGVERTLVIRNI